DNFLSCRKVIVATNNCQLRSNRNGSDENVVSWNYQSFRAQLSFQQSCRRPILFQKRKIMTQNKSLFQVAFLVGLYAREQFKSDRAGVGSLISLEEARDDMLYDWITFASQKCHPCG